MIGRERQRWRHRDLPFTDFTPRKKPPTVRAEPGTLSEQVSRRTGRTRTSEPSPRVCVIRQLERRFARCKMCCLKQQPLHQAPTLSHWHAARSHGHPRPPHRRVSTTVTFLTLERFCILYPVEFCPHCLVLGLSYGWFFSQTQTVSLCLSPEEFSWFPAIALPLDWVFGHLGFDLWWFDSKPLQPPFFPLLWLQACVVYFYLVDLGDRCSIFKF